MCSNSYGNPPQSVRNPRLVSTIILRSLSLGRVAAAAVELAVEDLLPGAEIKTAIGDRYHHLAPITCRFMCASALSSPVSLWRYCEVGACGASFFSHLSYLRAGRVSSSLINTDAVMCIALTAPIHPDTSLPATFLDLGGYMMNAAAKGDIETRVPCDYDFMLLLLCGSERIEPR